MLFECIWKTKNSHTFYIGQTMNKNPKKSIEISKKNNIYIFFSSKYDFHIIRFLRFIFIYCITFRRTIYAIKFNFEISTLPIIRKFVFRSTYFTTIYFFACFIFFFNSWNLFLFSKEKKTFTQSAFCFANNNRDTFFGFVMKI